MFLKSHYKTVLVFLAVLGLAVLAVVCHEVFLYDYRAPAGFVANNYSNPITSDTSISVDFSPRYGRLQTISLRFVVPKAYTDAENSITLSLHDDNGIKITEKRVKTDEFFADSFHTLYLAEPLKKGATYHLEITTDSLTLEDDIRLNMGTAPASEVTAWYYGAQAEPDLPEVFFSYRRVGWLSVGLYAGMIALMLLTRLLPPIPAAGGRLAYNILLVLAAPVGLLYITEQLQGGSIFLLPLLAIGLNYLLLLMPFVLFFAIFNRFAPATIIATALIAVGGVVNHYVLLFRKTVVLPADLYGAKTAFEVMSGYQFTLSVPVLLAIAFLAAIICCATINRAVIKGVRWRLATGGVAVALVALNLFLHHDPYRFYSRGIELNHFSQTEQSKIHGFYLNVALNAADMRLRAPEGYDEDNLVAQLPDSTEPATEVKPHVIVIMNESLTDFSYFGDIHASQDPLPFIHSLAGRDDAYVGKAVVPVFGANTSCSEYEGLTGFSLALNYHSNAPYSQLVKKDTPSLARSMQALGYHTLGTHPAPAGNWSRNTAYPHLGFDDVIFEEGYKDYGKFNYQTTDQGMYDFLIDYYTANNDEPLFMFGVTIQNHGGYAFDPKAEPGDRVEVLDTAGVLTNTYPTTYLSMTRKSDKAFQHLIEYFEEQQEPVIVVMYGDHWPGLESTYYDMVLGKTQDQLEGAEKLMYYTTPLVVWNNFGLDLTGIPGQMSTNYLAPLLKSTVGLPLSRADAFLLEMAADYPVVANQGVLAADGTYYEDVAQTGDARFSLYNQLVYNGLTGSDPAIFEVAQTP